MVYSVNYLQQSENGGSTVGYNVLISNSLPTADYWYWIGISVLLVYALFFNNMVTVALTFLNRKFSIIFPTIFPFKSMFSLLKFTYYFPWAGSFFSHKYSKLFLFNPLLLLCPITF